MVGYWLHESSEEKEMDSGRSAGRGLTVTEDLPEEAGRTRSFPVNGPREEVRRHSRQVEQHVPKNGSVRQQEARENLKKCGNKCGGGR